MIVEFSTVLGCDWIGNQIAIKRITFIFLLAIFGASTENEHAWLIIGFYKLLLPSRE